MATTRHSAYISTIQTALTTELNSLANLANSAASATITNTTDRVLYFDFTFVLAAQAVARTNGAAISVFMVHALDGTNFDDVNNVTAELVLVLPFDAATTGRQLTRRDVPVPPGLFQFFIRNATGQALAASGNILEYRAHNVETV